MSVLKKLSFEVKLNLSCLDVDVTREITLEDAKTLQRQLSAFSTALGGAIGDYRSFIPHKTAPKSYTQLTSQILDYAKTHHPFIAKDVMRDLECAESTAQKLLKDLVNSGVLQRKNISRNEFEYWLSNRKDTVPPIAVADKATLNSLEKAKQIAVTDQKTRMEP